MFLRIYVRVDFVCMFLCIRYRFCMRGLSANKFCVRVSDCSVYVCVSLCVFVSMYVSVCLCM